MKKVIAFLSALTLCTNFSTLTISAEEISYNTTTDSNVVDSVYVNDDIFVEFNSKQVDGMECYDSIIFTIPTYYFSENDNYVLEDISSFTTEISDDNNNSETIYSGLQTNFKLYYEKNNQLYEIEDAYNSTGLYKQTMFGGSFLRDADNVKVVYTIEDDEPLITPDSEYSDYTFNTYNEETEEWLEVSGVNTKVDKTTLNLDLEFNNWNKTEATSETYGISLNVVNSSEGSEIVLNDNSYEFLGTIYGYKNGYSYSLSEDVTEVPVEYYKTMLNDKQCLSGTVNDFDYQHDIDYYTNIDNLMLSTQYYAKDFTVEGYENIDLKDKDYCLLEEPLTQLVDITDKTGTLIIKPTTLNQTKINVNKYTVTNYSYSGSSYETITLDNLADNYSNKEIEAIIEDFKQTYSGLLESDDSSDFLDTSYFEALINEQTERFKRDYIEINLDELNEVARIKAENNSSIENYKLYLIIGQETQGYEDSLIMASDDIIPTLNYTLDYSDYDNVEVNYGLFYNDNALSVINTTNTVKGDLNYTTTLSGVDLLLMKKAILGVIDVNDYQERNLDINSDGNVDILDFIEIKRILF